MNNRNRIRSKNIGLFFFSVLAGLYLAAAANCAAQSSSVSLPPGVQDVVKLAHAGMSDDVILAQIKNQGASYALSADQIIYLNNQGVSQTVIKALLGNADAAAISPAPVVPAAPVANPAPTVPTPTTPPPPAPATAGVNDYQSQLAPYGSWIEVPGYGSCWQPSIAVTDPLWRPYFNGGHWVYSDDGWFWQSDYPWGPVVFHYGRWLRASVGWVWVPGYDWAPAWVCWRHTDAYCGWAPLPPAAVFKAGVGLYFGGHVALDVDFGLGVDAFTFVAYDHFWDHDLRLFRVGPERAVVIFKDSRIVNGYRFENGRFMVEGIGHDRIIALTHQDFRVEDKALRDSRYHGRGDLRDWHDDRRDHHIF